MKIPEKSETIFYENEEYPNKQIWIHTNRYNIRIKFFFNLVKKNIISASEYRVVAPGFPAS